MVLGNARARPGQQRKADQVHERALRAAVTAGACSQRMLTHYLSGRCAVTRQHFAVPDQYELWRVWLMGVQVRSCTGTDTTTRHVTSCWKTAPVAPSA